MLRRALFQIGWHLHRLLYRLTGGRAGGSGTLELRTVGRRSGDQRMTLLSYLGDGENLVVVGSNAGSERPPAWSLNLEAAPDAEVVLGGRAMPVHAHWASGPERDRLWSRLQAGNPAFERYQEMAGREVPVIVLEPRARA
ncbi:MAG: nitroreductase/quinone reductase family protein [Candidatus Limnocylindria bacterium]